MLALLITLISCKDTGHSETASKIALPQQVTFAEHIAPILFNQCSVCHRPGEAGGFSLLSYQDAFANANKIKFVTSTRFMPPWPADPAYSHFIGERMLSETEILLIKKWVDEGKAAGDTGKLPPLPSFYSGTLNRQPDLVLRLQHPVQLKGDGTDHFLTLKFPYTLPKDTFAKIIEFVPHQRKLIHHVNGHLLSYDAARKFNYYSGECIMPDERHDFKSSFRQMQLSYTDHPDEFPPLTPNTVYYLPGYTPPGYPDEVGGYVLKKDGVILIKNIHYGPSAIDVTDSSTIRIYYSPRPPKRPLRELQLGTFGVSPVDPPLIIPANTIKTFHCQWTCPQDISLLSVNPHMHLLGKSFLAYALTSHNDTIPLIRINKWDFRWQYYYTFKKMLKIPAGSTIHVFATYDNTAANPFNPFHPPQTVSEGEGNESMSTREEMLQFIFSYVPYKYGDENISLEGKE